MGVPWYSCKKKKNESPLKCKYHKIEQLQTRPSWSWNYLIGSKLNLPAQWHFGNILFKHKSVALSLASPLPWRLVIEGVRIKGGSKRKSCKQQIYWRRPPSLFCQNSKVSIPYLQRYYQLQWLELWHANIKDCRWFQHLTKWTGAKL